MRSSCCLSLERSRHWLRRTKKNWGGRHIFFWPPRVHGKMHIASFRFEISKLHNFTRKFQLWIYKLEVSLSFWEHGILEKDPAAQPKSKVKTNSTTRGSGGSTAAMAVTEGAEEASSSLEEALKRVTREARELYVGFTVCERVGPVEPLEFYRDFVSLSKPAIFRGAARNWPAVQKWTNDYLLDKLKGLEFSVAYTPNGRADAVSEDDSGNRYFCKVKDDGVFTSFAFECSHSFLCVCVFRWHFRRSLKPDTRSMTFADFLKSLEETKKSGKKEVPYIQLQNDSLHTEFGCLKGDVPPNGPTWAVTSFNCTPEAANVWIGGKQHLFILLFLRVCVCVCVCGGES